MSDSVELRHYVSRANDFLDGMQVLRTDNNMRNSSALLGIHSAISFSDALRIGLGETRIGSEDHASAAEALRKLLAERSAKDQSGLSRLRTLLSKKSRIAYESKRLDNTDFEFIYTHAERFANWANSVAKQLSVQDWSLSDDNAN